jgi:signal transduction histidine kinase
MLSTDLSEHALLDALPVSVYSLDLDGNLTSVRQAAPRFSEDAGPLAVTIGDGSRGTPIWDAMRDIISREQIEHGMQLLRTGRAPVVQWELERGPDERVLLAQMTPLHDDTHAVNGFVVCTVDITTRHQAREAAFDSGIALARAVDPEQAYHEAAQQLRGALRADVVVVAVIDDHGASPRIVYDVGSDSDRQSLERRFARAWQSALETGRVVASRDDSTVAMTAALLGETRPLGAISMITDIESPGQTADSSRHLSAVATQLSSAIDRARHVAHVGRRHRSGAIGEVAARVAQELRNPIFGISSAAQLLRFRAREDPVMETNVGRILREVERLNRMVSTLVELGRPIVLAIAPGDPDAIWDDVLESERGRLEARAIAIRRTKPDTPALIAIDGEQLTQAFKSILSNAVDAAPVATDISLQSTLLPNGGWRCRLTNNGAPIPPEMLPRVFEPFLSTKPGSSGVGLALAQRIVEEHQGTIAIESAAETGTTVVVSLSGPLVSPR